MHRQKKPIGTGALLLILLAAGSLPLQAQDYTPLRGLRVSNGQVQFSLFSATGGCIFLPSSISGVAYTVHTSKWHARAGATWVDIPGTESAGGLCSYAPTSPGEYRLVAEISIDGARGHYSSENTLTVEGTARTAPADEQAFHGLVVGQRILSDSPSYYVDFGAVGRFKETEGAETYAGSYSYSNTGANTGTVVLNYDDGDRCTARLVFTSTTAGTASSRCTSVQANWRLARIPEPGVSDSEVASYGIDTFAGLRVSGDGGPAVEAWLDSPEGVAVDGAGNVYIADSYNHRVRRVDATGTITTIAGTGERGFSGDGGPASQAQLVSPDDVAADRAGNLYIADSGNHRIRRVDATGTITTIAGSGEWGFSGDGGPASQAQLREPGGVAVDGLGNVYIADTYNHRVRRVDATGTITTIAGTGERGFSGDGGPAGQAQLSAPFDVAADGAGNVYFAEYTNHRIRKVDAAGTITTFAGTGEFGLGGDGGPAVEAPLGYPRGVAVDGAGNVYISPRGLGIGKVDSTGTITTIAGTERDGFGGDGGPASQARFHYPAGIAVDVAGNLYIADSGNHRIRKIDATGTITTIAGRTFSGDGGPASQAQLSEPEGVAADRAGNVYIADSNNHRIRKVDATGTITTIAGTGESDFSGDGGPAVEASLRYPRGVAVDGLGNLYIADTSNGRIRRVDFAGTITTIAGGGVGGDGGPASQAQFREPGDVAVDGLGNLYIADRNNQRIRKVDFAGTITTIAGTGERGFSGDGGPASQAQLSEPEGVAVDEAGNLYIADSFNHRIRKVDSAGTITTIAGTGERGFSGDGGPASQAQLSYPQGVAMDGAGNLYIVDQHNNRVRKVDATGTITTIAGSGERGFAGDSGPAVEAELDLPADVAVDTEGNVYIADWLNHVIRKLVPADSQDDMPPASPSFGTATVSNRTYTAGTAISALTLPAASGGDGSLAYSLAPAVPGLSFNAATRVLAGTPTAAGTYTMTYTVRDADGDLATLSFVVTVATVQMTAVDLVVSAVTASDDTPGSGQSFDLTATTSNSGTAASAATTLRFYRSTNTTISSSDTQVGTAAVGALAAGGTSSSVLTLTAPSTAGTYYYGACVDRVSGESNSQNNCSTGVRVTAAQASDEDVYVRHESLTVGGRGWVSFFRFVTYQGCIHLTGSTVIDGADRYMLVSTKWQTRANSSDAWADIPGTLQSGSLCAYDPVGSGEYRLVAEISINGVVGKYSSNLLGDRFYLASANRDASGITYANGKLYVEGRKGFFTRKVYAHEPSGQRDPDSDFDLDSANIGGITFANDRFYAVDLQEQKAYAYHASGQRDSASDFNLDSANSSASGITYANDRFFVVDWGVDKVYAYTASGQRDSASDFALDSANGSAEGITFANDRFYVVDRSDKVYAYHASGQRDSASDFNLDSANSSASGITYANDRFYVVDDADTVFVYER